MSSIRTLLKSMKDNPPTKKMAEALPPDALKKVWLYYMAYVLEETPIKIQPTLSVSRTDGKKFTMEDLLNGLPEMADALSELFLNKKTLVASFPRKLRGRGHTLLFILKI